MGEDVKQNPTISIIVPVYNVKPYLEKCIKSILNQTFEDFELLLINDGSTDGSGSICDDFALQDGRIIVFHQENQGLPNARNVGLKKACGEWIGFVDADDFCEENMFEVLLKNATLHEVDFSVCGFREVCENDRRFDYLPGFKSNFMQANKALDVWLNKNYFIMCCNILVKAKLLEQNSIDFDEKYKLHEDKLFMYKVLKRVDKIYVCDDLLYNYLRRENSLSTYVKIDEKKLSAIELFDEMIGLEENVKIKTDIRIEKILRLVRYAQICVKHDINNPYYKAILKHLKEEFAFAMTSDKITFKQKLFIIFAFFPRAFLAILKIKAFLRKLF